MFYFIFVSTEGEFAKLYLHMMFAVGIIVVDVLARRGIAVLAFIGELMV